MWSIFNRARKSMRQFDDKNEGKENTRKGERKERIQSNYEDMQ